MKIFKSPPEKLIDETGKPAFGLYNAPIANLNLGDFDFRQIPRMFFSIFKKTAGLAKKRWQYLGVVDDNLVIGVAVIHLGYLGSAFAYVYRKDTKELKELNIVDPGAGKTVYSDSSIYGFSSCRAGSKFVRLNNDVSQGPREMEVVSPGMQINIEAFDPPEGFTPLVACLRNGIRGFNYTHKGAGLYAKGWVEIDGEKIELTKNALAVLDWTAGCAAHETYWNWASGTGRLADGRIAGINFAMGVNETGFTENVFWIDGAPHKVDVVNFDYNFKNIMAPWTIRSMDGKVDLTFTPEGERKENQNYLIVASNFRQPFGKFNGTLILDGKALEVLDLYGFVEEHYVKW